MLPAVSVTADFASPPPAVTVTLSAPGDTAW